MRTKIGSCSNKHYLLGYLLQEKGIQVKYLTYPFYWQDLPIQYPENIKKFFPHLPIQYHLALMILIEGTEKLLDATWDKGLTSIKGLTINEFNEMDLAVVPCQKPIIHFSAIERWQYIEHLKQSIPNREAISNFYKAMSKWLNAVRSFELINNNNFPNVEYHDSPKI